MVRYNMDELCSHRQHDTSHEFVFHQSGRTAVDAWAAKLEELQLQGKWYGLPLVRLLLDARDVDLPVRYLFECLSDYNRGYRNLTPPSVRIAFVHDPTMIILDVFKTFAELMTTPVEIEFFPEKDYAAAVQWLQR
jgi:hypothetical protein